MADKSLSSLQGRRLREERLLDPRVKTNVTTVIDLVTGRVSVGKAPLEILEILDLDLPSPLTEGMIGEIMTGEMTEGTIEEIMIEGMTEGIMIEEMIGEMKDLEIMIDLENSIEGKKGPGILTEERKGLENLTDQESLRDLMREGIGSLRERNKGIGLEIDLL